MLDKNQINLEHIISEYQKDIIDQETTLKHQLKSKLFIFFSLSFLMLFSWFLLFKSPSEQQKHIEQQNISFYSSENKANRIGKPSLKFLYSTNDNSPSFSKSTYNFTLTFINSSDKYFFPAYDFKEFYRQEKNQNNDTNNTIFLDIIMPTSISITKEDLNNLHILFNKNKKYYGNDKENVTGFLKSLTLNYLISKEISSH